MVKEPLTPPESFETLDERKYGKARLLFLRNPSGWAHNGAMGQPSHHQPDPYRQLTWLIWKHRIWVAARICLVVIPILAALVAFVGDPYGDPEIVTGTVVGLHQTQSETARNTQFVVRLDSGETVIVSNSEWILFEKGRSAVLEWRQSMLFGWQRYRFVRYLENDEIAN